MLDELRSKAKQDNVEFFFAMFVDHGKPCAKLVPAEALEILLSEGPGLPALPPGTWARAPQTRT